MDEVDQVERVAKAIYCAAFDPQNDDEAARRKPSLGWCWKRTSESMRAAELRDVDGVHERAVCAELNLRDAKSTISRLEGELKKKEQRITELGMIADPPIARLQFPDGSVPGNGEDAVNGWYKLYREATAEIDRLREALRELWDISCAESVHGKTGVRAHPDDMARAIRKARSALSTARSRE